MRRADLATIRWLIFCFPAGLLMMWSNRCHFPRAVKSSISLCVAVLLLAVFLPQTRPPERATGGVEIVGLVPASDAFGPFPEENFDRMDIYAPVYAQATSVLVEPEATPTPIKVYCNNGGQYYHTAECTYRKKTTPKTTLTAAVDAGFKPCPDCNPPTEQ